MRTNSRSLAEKFHGVVDRMLAALHQQRASEARRVLRFRHKRWPAEQKLSPAESRPLPGQSCH